MFEHVGVYAYTRECLLRLAALPVSPLEEIESLEQLRALENGIPILVVETRSRAQSDFGRYAGGPRTGSRSHEGTGVTI